MIRQCNDQLFLSARSSGGHQYQRNLYTVIILFFQVSCSNKKLVGLITNIY